MTFELHSRSPASGAPRADGSTDSESGEARDGQGADGCSAVTSRTGAGTSGVHAGTNGWTSRRVLLAGMALWVALLAIQCGVNALSYASEHPEMPAWHGWTLEMTSAVGWLLVTPLHWRLVRWLAAHTHRPLLVAGVAVAASVALSLIHVGTMMSLRVAIFAAAGDSYDPSSPWSAIFLYEYRKDVSALLQIGLGFFLIQGFMRRAELNAQLAEGAPQPRSETIVEVQDGASLHFVPLREIDQVAAAGNYVEIAWRGRTLLHRTTLAALEQAWSPHGFVRIHRGTLVRAASVVRIETLKSGDFLAELASGELVRGSRRYRAALDGTVQAL
jgi:hypothetical protein